MTDTRAAFEAHFQLSQRQAKKDNAGEYIDEFVRAKWEGWQAARSGWITVGAQLPPDETPVLLLVSGTIYEGVMRWDNPGFEDTYQPYRYFIDTDKACDWEWSDVTHWMPRPEMPKCA